MPQYMFRKVKNNKFKKKLKFKGKIILFFGRFNITKGADVLALAAKELIKERKDLNFLFVGPDEGIKQKVKDIVKGEKRIKVLDPIRGESRVEVYQSADVFLLPSYREGLPLTLFEAMASGLPIVASPVNGIPFEMKDPENGYFVKYGDVKGLKEKILKILDNPKIAKKMSQNNLKKAKQYTWDLINERYVNEYKKLIK
jgi:N,N'-diacetylbacillosaminyl-diphospho-undecaprenol alpha-1,3-N-acetylgalactosaminyltransferase